MQRAIRNTAFFYLFGDSSTSPNTPNDRVRKFFGSCPSPNQGSFDDSIANQPVAFRLVVRVPRFCQLVSPRCRLQPIGTVHTTLILGQSLCVVTTCLHLCSSAAVIFSYDRPAVSWHTKSGQPPVVGHNITRGVDVY